MYKRIICIIVALFTLVLTGSSIEYEPAYYMFTEEEPYQNENVKISFVSAQYLEDKTILEFDMESFLSKESRVIIHINGYQDRQYRTYNCNYLSYNDEVFCDSIEGEDDASVLLPAHSTGRVVLEINEKVVLYKGEVQESTYLVFSSIYIPSRAYFVLTQK